MAVNTYSLIITYGVGGQFAQNVLHYSMDDGGYSDTQSAASALINAWDTANTANLKNLLNNSTSIRSYKSRSLSTGGGFEAIKLLAGPPAGTRVGSMSVSAVGPVAILFPIGNAKQRGRVFLPGINDGDLIDGDISAGYRTAFTANSGMFTRTLTLAGGGTPVATPVIYSRLPKPSVTRTIEYVRLSDTPGQMFRRQRPA